MKKEVTKRLLENKVQIKKFMGYGARAMPAIIEKKLTEELKSIHSLIEPSCSYKIVDLEEIPELFEYNTLKEQKKKAKKLALMIYTIGNEIEKQIEKYSQSSEMIRSLILDKSGIVALDVYKDIIIEDVQRQTGLKCIYEAYPSNLDFPVQGQKLIYDKIPNTKSISINEHYQLSPIKSVAVVVVLGEEEMLFDRCKVCGACMVNEN